MQKKCMGWITAAALATGLGTAFAANGDAYTWPAYRSDLDYDTKTNLGDIQPPTKFNTNCSGVTGKKAGKWWAFYWGSDRDSRITDVTIDSILKKYDTDFGYLYDTMGWAPDAQAQDGQYSAIYYYGSGTCAGGAKTDTTGGWQTWVAGYTAVAASFYPLYSFNTSCPYHDRVSQMDAMIHEGIHSMTNGYPGAKDAHWFQEAGNTWIQQDMFSHRNNIYSGMGFLNASTVIAPFMPIECYSGWLIDGTFGGPGAQGVTGKNQRSLLGGAQYSNIFPTFMGTWLGTGSVRWVYGHAYGDTPYLMETYGLDIGLGDEGVRRLITEFRARLAMLDMKDWSNEIKNLLNQNFGSQTYWEQDFWDNGNYSYTWTMTPYQSVTESNGEWVPNQDITPGWTGANVIPLKLNSGATQISMTMYPNGSYATNDNMRLVLAYRATDGTPVYSEPVKGNETAILRLDKTPSTTSGSKMAFAIVVNTDYGYSKNPDMRTYHYDYRLKPEEGIAGAGAANVKYYNDFVLTYDWPEIGDAPVASSSSTSSSSVTPASSSSAEVQPGSSSSIVDGKSTLYEIKITLPIDENYAPVAATFSVDEVAKSLGLTAATLSQATFFAQGPDGNIVTQSTANEPGHWFSKDGSVVEWGETAYLFSEANLTQGTLSVGHYPNRVSNGETYSFVQGLSYNGNKVLFNVTVTITNEEGSGESETTNAVMYGLEGLSTHMELTLRQGKIMVNYSLPQKDNVKISLFTGFGALVAQEITGLQNAGTHAHSFDMSQMPAATYIVKVSTGSYREAKSINVTRTR